MDSKFKLDVIEDILASKEMYLGRHYIKKEKWIAAMNRFKHVIDKYDRTIFVEEALHRLVEINYKIGVDVDILYVCKRAQNLSKYDCKC